MADIDLEEEFRERCRVAAVRFRKQRGWIGYVVDPLQAWAVKKGLVRKIGQDAVQAIMAEYFGEDQSNG